MASKKLKAFLEDNFRWDVDDIKDNEMVTEAVIMYRLVRVDADDEELPERVDYVTSRSCSFTMAIGMVEQVRSAWEYEFIKKVDEEDGEES